MFLAEPTEIGERLVALWRASLISAERQPASKNLAMVSLKRASEQCSLRRAANSFLSSSVGANDGVRILSVNSLARDIIVHDLSMNRCSKTHEDERLASSLVCI